MFKKIMIAGTVLAVLTCTGFVFAETKQVKIINAQQFDRVMNNYLYKKSAEDLYAIANYISSTNLLEHNKTAKSPIRGFFMGIKHDNPAAFKNLQKMNLSKSAKLSINAADEFSADMELFLNNKMNYLPESAAFLDMMWGYFYATGDTRVLNKMCQVQKSSENSLIRAAAKWSYESNMKKFPSKIKPCK